MSRDLVLPAHNFDVKSYVATALDEKIARDQFIKNLAIDCLAEIAINATFLIVSYFFIATTWEFIFFTGVTLLITVMNLFAKCTRQKAIYQIEHPKFSKDKIPDAQMEKKNAENFAALNHAILFGITGNVLIHEGGHALAASLLYKGAHPTVRLVIGGGYTSWYLGPLSKIGRALGPKLSRILVTAGGALAAIAVATALLFVAIKLEKSHPLCSNYCFTGSVLSIFHHAFYASEALLLPCIKSSHDFVMLNFLGIHPLISIITIIAIPTLAYLGYLAYLKATGSYDENNLPLSSLL